MQGFVARKALEAISPYVAGKPIEETAREYGLDPARIVKLASNENPLGMSPKAKNAAMQALVNGTRYPDGAAQVARGILPAALFGQQTKRFLIIGKRQTEISQRPGHLFQHQIGDPAERVLGKRIENNDLIDTRQKLRT